MFAIVSNLDAPEHREGQRAFLFFTYFLYKSTFFSLKAMAQCPARTRPSAGRVSAIFCFISYIKAFFPLYEGMAQGPARTCPRTGRVCAASFSLLPFSTLINTPHDAICFMGCGQSAGRVSAASFS